MSVCNAAEGLSPHPTDVRRFGAADNFELTVDWFVLLHRHVFANDPGVRYYFVAEDDRLRTILPVRLVTERGVKSVESLSNYYTALYSPVTDGQTESRDIAPILAAANRDHRGADVMRFAPMAPDSVAYESLLAGLRANGWVAFPFFCFGNWYLRVEGNWDVYIRTRSANMRSNIKRMNKKFAADNGKLEIVTDLANMERALTAFQTVYSASWKVPEPHPDFVPGLVRRLAENGSLRMGIAWLGERPIAAQLWIVTGHRSSIYKVAYDESFAEYSPGTLVSAHVMKHVIDADRVTEVDFLIGDDKYKQAWMSDRRERAGIIAYNPKTIVGLMLLLREAGWRLAKKVMTRFKPGGGVPAGK